MTNPYVVTEDTLPKDPNAAPESITGIGILESFHDVQSLNDESSWVESGLAYGGMAMEAVSMVVDPIGTLLSYGLSWLIEHVEPLKEALDWFAGDPDGVKAYGATWANVSQAVGQAAQQYSQAVEAHTAEWTGAAGDAYRRYAAEKGEALVGASELANTISTVVTVMGEVVSFVREFVRDLVADCISRLITYALEALAPPLVSLSWVVPQAVAFISKTVTKIADVVQKLTKTISNVSPKLGRMVEAFSKVMELLGKLGKKAGEAAGSAISTVGRVADKIDIPGRMADRLAESAWGKVDDAFGTNITGRNSPDAPNADGSGGDGTSPSTGGDDPGTTPSTGGNGPGPTGTGGDGNTPSTDGTSPGPTGTSTSPTSPSAGGNGPGPTGTGGDGTSPSTNRPGPTGTGETPSTTSSPGTDGSTPGPNGTDGNAPGTGGNGSAPNGTGGDAPSTSSTTGDAPGTGPSPLGSNSPDGVGGTSPTTSPGTSPGVSGGTGPGGTSPSPGPTSTTDAPTGNGPAPSPASSPEPRTTSFTGDLSGGGGSTPSTPAGGTTPSTPSTPDGGSAPSGHVPSPSGTSGTTPTTPSTTSSSSVDAPAGPTPQTPAPGAPRPDQPTGTTPSGGAMGGATPGGAGGPSGGSPSGPTGRPGSGGGWTGTPGSPGAARPPSTPDTPAPRPRGGDAPPRTTPQRPDAPAPRPAPQRPQGLGGEPPRPRPDTARPDGGRPQPPGQQPPRPSTPGPTRPDGFRPDPAKPDMAKPDAGKPDPTKPESTTPSNDPAKPGTTKPDADRPGDRPPNADKPRDPDGGDRPADAQPRQDPDRPADADNPRPGTPEYERKIDEGVDHLRDNRTDAGASGHTDPNMQDLARRVPDDGEHFTLDAHMGPDGRIQIGDRSYSVDEFADLMRRNPDWDGKPIRLVSCDSGDFAADLSRKLEVDVTAPRGKAWTDGQGQVFASSTDPDGGPGWPPDGGWDTHSPDGTSSPASTDGFHPTRDGEDPGSRPDDAEARGQQRRVRGVVPENKYEQDALFPENQVPGRRLGAPYDDPPEHVEIAVLEPPTPTDTIPGIDPDEFSPEYRGPLSHPDAPEPFARWDNPDPAAFRNAPDNDPALRELDEKEPFSSREAELKPFTRYAVEGRGVFYTDERGRIKWVDIDRSDTDLNPVFRNPDLNNPLPNAQYRVDRNWIFNTDPWGRTESMSGVPHIRGTPSALPNNMYGRDKGAQDASRDEGNAVYSTYKWAGGHMAAHNFGGPGEYINMFPQMHASNSGNNRQGWTPEASWYKLEQYLTEHAKKPGCSVDRIEVFAPRDKDGIPREVRYRWVETSADGKSRVKEAIFPNVPDVNYGPQTPYSR
ncbi:hypothetical protein [Saccharopolyspora cebuensis]|uniref:DNA/RNA non-specific endonuclease n=1 Tax=Saccharopolyspora cebuensis TaxID=418759 RepID=A0ABV4CI37_9PSEU